MPQRILTFLIGLLFTQITLGNTPNPNNILIQFDAREGTSLSGDWNYIIDPYEVGFYNYRLHPFDEMEKPYGGFFLDESWDDKTKLIEYSFDQSPTLKVPGDWNSQSDELKYYEGVIWYRRTFQYDKLNDSNLAVLHFGGANYEVHVYLNGNKLGKHVGGFTPFQFDISKVLKVGKNSLVVKVDNRRSPEAVPTVNTDWWNYGGITREVMIYQVPEKAILDYSLQLSKSDRGTLEIEVTVQNTIDGFVEIEIPEIGAEVKLPINALGEARGQLTVPNLELWSPSNPKLYAVKIRTENDSVSDSIGFRTIDTGGGQIQLNGKPIFLRGISLHEENPLEAARVTSVEECRMLLGWAKELGCNFVRLAHYPHNINMAREADKMGILLWEEVPVYWTIHWENEATLLNAEQQLRDLILRDKNRASVIIWSVANETPLSKPRLEFLKHLISTARSLDNSRLISAAMEKHNDREDPSIVVVNDPLLAYTDLASFNTYIGWYGSTPDACANVNWRIESDKPVIISEFGAGALHGLHGDKTHRFTEEYQEWLYAETLPMLERIPNLAGMTPWILTDFRSPRRVLPDIQDGWNRKGLLSNEGKPKAAYFVLKEYYKEKEAESR